MLLAASPNAASSDETGASFRLMRSSPLSTAVHVLDSGRAGPIALVVGGIHGDEPAGMAAAQRLIAEKPPLRGKLLVIPVANRPAAELGVRMPYYMQDLNRSFPGSKARNDTEQLAASIMDVVARYRPSIAIDLHEAGASSDPDGSEVANTLILSEGGRAAEIALAVLEAINPARTEKPFSFLSGAPAGSFNREVSRRFGIPVITVETSRQDPLPLRVQTQVEIVKRILNALEDVGR